MNLKCNETKVLFELLSACNLKCSHCLYKNDKLNQGAHLSKNEIFLLIDKFKNNKINKLVLTGGEPTIHPHFLEISKYAKIKIPKVTLCTNGVITDKKLENEIVKLNFDTYTVSIDSHIEKVHNKFRGDNFAYKNTINFTKKLLKNKRNISIHIILHELNINHIEKTISFCKKFSNEIVVSAIYKTASVKMSKKEKIFAEKVSIFKDKYIHSPDIELVGFEPFCSNKKCLDQKNFFLVNKEGNHVTCYWKKDGGSFIKKY